LTFTLDTNILVYAVDVDIGDKHAIALDIVERAFDADGVLTLQCLGEFFHVATRKGRLDAKSAAILVKRFCAVFPVVDANVTTLDQAMDGVSRHGLAFWDAMLWATARDAGCRLILSEDFQDGQTLEGVTFLNPFAARNRVLVERALRPRRGSGVGV